MSDIMQNNCVMIIVTVWALSTATAASSFPMFHKLGVVTLPATQARSDSEWPAGGVGHGVHAAWKRLRWFNIPGFWSTVFPELYSRFSSLAPD
jgi:hypothetical protein